MSSWVIPTVARITGVSGRLDIAESAARSVLSSPSPAPNIAMDARIGSALIAVYKGDVEGAGEQYEALKGLRMLNIGLISSDHLLGLLAQTMGKLDEAAGHFEDALALCRKGGGLPELAWSASDYADVLLQRASEGPPEAASRDRQKAVSLLDESLSVSRELGMGPLAERVLARYDVLKGDASQA